MEDFVINLHMLEGISKENQRGNWLMKKGF